MAKSPPESGLMLVRGALTGSVYVVTKWRRNPDGTIEALTKHDVTEQYEALHAEITDNNQATSKEQPA